MPYETDIQVNDDYIRIEVSGARHAGQELEDATAVGLGLSELLEQTGRKKVLAVFRMTGRLPPIASYEIFSKPEDFGWYRDVKLAVVDMNAESRHDSHFSETVAVNRAYQMAVFEDEDEALNWLMKYPQRDS